MTQRSLSPALPFLHPEPRIHPAHAGQHIPTQTSLPAHSYSGINAPIRFHPRVCMSIVQHPSAACPTCADGRTALSSYRRKGRREDLVRSNPDVLWKGGVARVAVYSQHSDRLRNEVLAPNTRTSRKTERVAGSWPLSPSLLSP